MRRTGFAAKVAFTATLVALAPLTRAGAQLSDTAARAQCEETITGQFAAAGDRDVHFGPQTASVIHERSGELVQGGGRYTAKADAQPRRFAYNCSGSRIDGMKTVEFDPPLSGGANDEDSKAAEPPHVVAEPAHVEMAAPHVGADPSHFAAYTPAIPTRHVQLKRGSTAIRGSLKGPTGDARDYVLSAKAGQTMTVALKARNSPTTYFEVQATGQDEALFNGEESSRKTWRGTVPADGDYTVRVHGDPAALQKGVSATYTLTVGIK